MNTSRIKYYIRRILNSVGIDVYPTDPRNSVQSYLEYLFEFRGVDAVIDIGANNGQYGAMLRNIGFKGFVYSYEPLEEAWLQLSKRASADDQWVIADRSAVTDSHREFIELYETENNVSSSVLSPKVDQALNVVNKPRCPAVNINSVLNFHANCGLLKLDVQGYESRLLKAIDPAVSYLPRFLQLELAIENTYEEEPLFQSVDQQLREIGYRLIFIFPGVADNINRLMQVEAFYERT